jgi:hypothetical protein
MNHGAVDTMFWVGGLMVAAPLLFFGTVIAIWWYQRKREAGRGKGHAGK